MKKAWSIFWLIVLSVIAFNILWSMMLPYIPAIALAISWVIVFVALYFLFRKIRSRRRFF